MSWSNMHGFLGKHRVWFRPSLRRGAAEGNDSPRHPGALFGSLAGWRIGKKRLTFGKLKLIQNRTKNFAETTVFI
jgi:hypothetical protein